MRSRLTLFLTALLVFGPTGCKKGSKRGSVKDLVTRTLSFEGDIEVETRLMSGTTVRSKYTMKGQKARIETGTIVMLADLDAKKSYMLNDVTKTYTVFDYGKYTPVDAGGPPVRTKTGKKDVIAGYACDEYEYTSGSDNSVSCVTTDIYGPMGAAAGALGVLGDDQGLALRTVTRNSSGVEVIRNEVTRIAKRAVPEGDVVVPPGYTETH